MTTPDSFALRLYPRRLLRSLITFAAAGTLMAAAVWSDGTGGLALPTLILAACWAIPAMFAWQIRRNGFDPLERLTFTDDGLLATYRDGNKRLLTWAGISRLVAVEAYRYRAWVVCHAHVPAVRWFGELEDEHAFTARLAERTGLSWERESKPPEA